VSWETMAVDRLFSQEEAYLTIARHPTVTLLLV
jgi:hypothetical protein